MTLNYSSAIMPCPSIPPADIIQTEFMTCAHAEDGTQEQYPMNACSCELACQTTRGVLDWPDETKPDLLSNVKVWED